MGIDPGLAKVGFGVVRKIQNPRPTSSRNEVFGKQVKSKSQKLRSLGYGCIETNPDLSNGERLKKINQELNKLIKEYKPDVLAIENVYFFKNLKTAMPVSQAKGVILFTAAKKKVSIYEFTPLQIKTAVTGYGRADKKQIKEMIKILLNLKEIPRSDDAADALGAAICYSRIFNYPQKK